MEPLKLKFKSKKINLIFDELALLNGDSKILQILQLLPYLLPVTSKAKNAIDKKKFWCPNSKESFRGLVLICAFEADIYREFEVIRSYKQKFKLCVQPQIVVVGTIRSPEKVFVFINETILQMHVSKQSWL